MKNSVFKSDRFKKTRGGYSRLLDISCAKCNEHLCYYQKDGPGMLKRLYLDRMFGSEKYSKQQTSALAKIPQLVCSACQEHLGTPIIYKKEDRLAFRLFAGAVGKKISNSNAVAF